MEERTVKVFRPAFLASRIGEMATQLGIFAMMMEMGWLERFFGVVSAPQGVSNPCLLDYFHPWVLVSDKTPPANLAGYNPVRPKFPNGRVYHEDRAVVAVFKAWEDQGRGPLLSLHPDHVADGRQTLGRMGVPGNAWFVAFHTRDRSSLNDPANDYRNSDPATYLEALRLITDAGGWVIRMGHPGMPPLPAMDRVIDYAHSPFTSDWMDVFLMGAARFFLGDTSGPVVPPALFGVPVARANNVPLWNRPFSGRDLFISKLYLAEGRPVPFDKSMSLPYLHNHRDPGPVRDNTAEEITELTREMLERVEGRAVYTAEDGELQGRYTQLCNRFEDYGVAARAGRDFLRRHRHLLP